MASLSPSTPSPLPLESVFLGWMLNMSHSQRSKEKKTQLLREKHAKKHRYISKLRKAYERMSSRFVSNHRKTVGCVAVRIQAKIANGRSLWRQAILMVNKLKCRLTEPKPQRMRPTRSRVTVYLLMMKAKKTKAMQQKVKRFLAQLIPGCRYTPFAAILEEAVDYIAALEMQVLAMDALVSFLSHSSSAPVSTLAPTTSY